jgi:GNAT superfamily N-acetyltransferase
LKTHLRSVTLKTGETMDVFRVTAPDAEFRERILKFLQHKGEPWQAPMEQNLEAELEGLGQHFYIGVVGEQIVGNASSVEALERPVGILQHVFTPPEWRRRGICSTLIRTYVEDFDARGGRAAYLHTGYDSAAYHIYRSAGFVGYRDTGIMERFPDPHFHEDFWAPRPVTIRDTRWSDWALVDALFGIEEGWYLRSVCARKWGRSGYEGEYVYTRQQMGEGSIIQVKVIEADNGAVVGYAHLSKDLRFRGDVWLLDVFVHPNYYAAGAGLLAAMDCSLDGKVQAYCDSQQPDKARMLESAGFSLEATLPSQVSKGEEWLDVMVYSAERVSR